MENIVESKEMISFIDSIKTSLRKFITSLLEMVIMVSLWEWNSKEEDKTNNQTPNSFKIWHKKSLLLMCVNYKVRQFGSFELWNHSDRIVSQM